MFSKCTYQCGTTLEVLRLERVEGSKTIEAREVIELFCHRHKERALFLWRLNYFTDGLTDRLHNLGSGRRNIGRACWVARESDNDTAEDIFPAVKMAVVILRVILGF